MQAKKLTWEFTNKEHCQWSGKLDGWLSHVRFFITPTGKDPNEYLVRTDTNGIPNETCIGLETAKAKAQELFNNYAIGLTIP